MEPLASARAALGASPRVVYAIDANYRLVDCNDAWNARAVALGLAALVRPVPGTLSVLGSMTPPLQDFFLEVYARLWTGESARYAGFVPFAPGRGYHLTVVREGDRLLHAALDVRAQRSPPRSRPRLMRPAGRADESNDPGA